MRIVKAEPHDNDRLCQYFNSMELPGDVDLRLGRESFFAPYALQSPDYTTYLLVNEDDQIEAMATLVFREGYLGGQKQTIGFALDLRVSPSRRAILNWAQHFLPILEEEKAKRQCRYVFSVVAQMQKLAYNAFIRPRLTRRSMPRYHLFRSFNLVSVHGVLPLARKPLSTIFLRRGSASDLSQVSEYLARQCQSSSLRFSNSAADIVDQIQRWPGLSVNDFILAFDFYRNLVGCVAPWQPDVLQTVTSLEYHRRAKVLYDSLKVLGLIGIAKRLPNPGRDLKFSYLTHFKADNPDIFHSLLSAAYRNSGKNQFVTYTHFADDLISLPPPGLITSTIRCGLYCIQAPQELSPEFLHWSRTEAPPELEMPII